jgi:hypothetical protein
MVIMFRGGVYIFLFYIKELMCFCTGTDEINPSLFI